MRRQHCSHVLVALWSDTAFLLETLHLAVVVGVMHTNLFRCLASSFSTSFNLSTQVVHAIDGRNDALVLTVNRHKMVLVELVGPIVFGQFTKTKELQQLSKAIGSQSFVELVLVRELVGSVLVNLNGFQSLLLVLGSRVTHLGTSYVRTLIF